MAIQNMHYDFLTKINKVDSQKNRNFKVPEIDWVLNEAANILIDMISFPKMFRGFGFELNQRSIDDLRPIVVDHLTIPATELSRTRYGFTLPANYRHHLSSKVMASKGTCSATIRTHPIQHDDKSEDSPFDKSSFEWREVNIMFNSTGIVAFTDGTFSITALIMDYLRKPLYMHAAGNAVNGEYRLPDGTYYSGFQNCELPSLEREIVDLAVLITTGNLLADYQAKQAKLQLIN